MIKMKVSITTPGDPSVGIFGDRLTIDWGKSQFENAEDRERIRKELTGFFNEFLDDGPVNVWFDDECPDCKQLLVENKCLNTNCISYFCREGRCPICGYELVTGYCPNFDECPNSLEEHGMDDDCS